MTSAQTSVSKFYADVIEDVMVNIKDDFLNEGFDETVLEDLRISWIKKALASKTLVSFHSTSYAKFIQPSTPGSSKASTSKSHAQNKTKKEQQQHEAVAAAIAAATAAASVTDMFAQSIIQQYTQQDEELINRPSCAMMSNSLNLTGDVFTGGDKTALNRPMHYPGMHPQQQEHPLYTNVPKQFTSEILKNNVSTEPYGPPAAIYNSYNNLLGLEMQAKTDHSDYISPTETMRRQGELEIPKEPTNGLSPIVQMPWDLHPQASIQEMQPQTQQLLRQQSQHPVKQTSPEEDMVLLEPNILGPASLESLGCSMTDDFINSMQGPQLQLPCDNPIPQYYPPNCDYAEVESSFQREGVLKEDNSKQLENMGVAQQMDGAPGEPVDSSDENGSEATDNIIYEGDEVFGGDKDEDDDGLSDVDVNSAELDVCADAGASEDEPLNSGDDVTDEDASEDFETDNVIVCQYDKITRSRNKWKFYLKDGIMNIAGKDYVFQKSSGDAEF